jgi:hypothetical protein
LSLVYGLFIDRVDDIRRRERRFLIDLGKVGGLSILLSLTLFFRLRGLVERLIHRMLLLLLLVVLVHVLRRLLLLLMLMLLVLLGRHGPRRSGNRAGNSTCAYGW